MSIKHYYEVELNTTMEDQEIGVLEDTRYLSGIGPTSFHRNKSMITMIMEDEDIKVTLSTIANWLRTAQLSDHVSHIREITEYSTGFVDTRLDNFIKAGKTRREENKRSRNKKRSRKT